MSHILPAVWRLRFDDEETIAPKNNDRTVARASEPEPSRRWRLIDARTSARADPLFIARRGRHTQAKHPEQYDLHCLQRNPGTPSPSWPVSRKQIATRGNTALRALLARPDPAMPK